MTALHDDLTLTAGYAGLTLTRGPDQRVTVRYADLAALVCWRDGKRGLVGGDGFVIILDPGQWPDGTALVAAVEGWAPPPLRVVLDSPGPAGPSRPRTEPGTGTAAGPAGEPAWPPGIARRMPWRLRIARALWALIFLTGAFSVAGGDVGGGTGFPGRGPGRPATA